MCAEAPAFGAVARTLGELIAGSWLVGHNVRFDVGFLAMEMALAGYRVEPAGCLDTCQLAAAAFELPDYRLDTLTAALGIQRKAKHRALDDALATKTVFDLTLREIGDMSDLTIGDLRALHRYAPTWPAHPRDAAAGTAVRRADQRATDLDRLRQRRGAGVAADDPAVQLLPRGTPRVRPCALHGGGGDADVSDGSHRRGG
jgi:DNA polymerase III epsilon subunit-like protein